MDYQERLNKLKAEENQLLQEIKDNGGYIKEGKVCFNKKEVVSHENILPLNWRYWTYQRFKIKE